MFFFDSTYILVIAGLLISMAASGYVKSTYAKYNNYKNAKGYTTTEVCQQILNDADIYDVGIQRIPGDLTDNYNSHTKMLSLSQTVADSESVAAIGVAAHECGHAVQDARHYVPLKIRGAIVPVVNFGSSISFPLIIIGLLFGGQSGQLGHTLINLGILCFSFVFIFQVVTLPVEFNASRRALAILSENDILDKGELVMARKVLFAAALTYVAAVLSTFLQLLRLILIFGNKNDRN